jgi:hyperosmotically inducible periplasmic protein
MQFVAAIFLFAASFGLSSCSPIGLAGLAADGAYTAAERRKPGEVIEDNQIKLTLNYLFLEESFGMFRDISTVVYRGRVFLLGTVESPQQRETAERLARRAKGAREIVNALKVGPGNGTGAYIDDIAIEKSIQTKLLSDSTVASANFRVRSVGGVVYLIGSAANESELTRAMQIARATNGVRSIVNYIEYANRAGTAVSG